MGLKERSAERRKRIVGNVAHSHEEAEAWDLAFWRSHTPRDLLPVLMSIREGTAHVTRRSREVERRELEFWQSRSPQDRLSAAAAIHEAVGRLMQQKGKGR